MIHAQLTKLTSGPKKYRVILVWPDGRQKTVTFGAHGMSDFTLHKDPARKQRYLTRHRDRETWTRAGLTTAGFWSRWLLWNQPSLQASKRDMSARFGLRFSARR